MGNDYEPHENANMCLSVCVNHPRQLDDHYPLAEVVIEYATMEDFQCNTWLVHVLQEAMALHGCGGKKALLLADLIEGTLYLIDDASQYMVRI
jgi:hypothetical protein